MSQMFGFANPVLYLTGTLGLVSVGFERGGVRVVYSGRKLSSNDVFISYSFTVMTLAL